MFSLPIFWVAVLLKQFLAIKFNDFLANARIPLGWAALLSLLGGFFWAGILGAKRETFYKVLGAAFLGNFLLLEFFSLTKWFATPKMGPIVVFLFAIGIAYAVTALSTGVEDKKALSVVHAPNGLLVQELTGTMLFVARCVKTVMSASWEFISQSGPPWQMPPSFFPASSKKNGLFPCVGAAGPFTNSTVGSS